MSSKRYTEKFKVEVVKQSSSQVGIARITTSRGPLVGQSCRSPYSPNVAANCHVPVVHARSGKQQ